MEQSKRIYETTFILNATLDDAQIDLVIEKFKDFVVKQGAEIRNLEKWGRKRLAYPIQKKNNGFYVLCEMAGPADMVQKLERYYALDENIMRFLTVSLSEKALKARLEQAKRAERQDAPPPPVEPKPAVKPVAPVADEDDEDDVT